MPPTSREPRATCRQITIDLQTTSLGLPQPPKTPTLVLNPFDDSSNTSHLPGQGLNVTNINHGALIGTTDPGATVSLFSGGQRHRQRVRGQHHDERFDRQLQHFGWSPGPTVRTPIWSRPRNSFRSRPRARSFPSPIKTQGPTTVPTLSLNPRDDTGVKGDGITANTRPRLIGTADPNVLVDILDANNDVLVTTTTDASGNYSVQLPGVLSNGTITLYARARDLANNIGPTSAPFVLTIDTTLPPPRRRRCSRRPRTPGARR